MRTEADSDEAVQTSVSFASRRPTHTRTERLHRLQTATDSQLLLASTTALPTAAAGRSTAMPLKAADISRVRNKVVRGELNQKRKKDLKQQKLKRRLERKEAEARGETVERGALPPSVRPPPSVVADSPEITRRHPSND